MRVALPLRVLPFLLVAMFFAGPAEGQDLPEEYDGRWRGALTFRGDVWPVRLAVESRGERCAAWLDLPALVMAREPVVAECADASVAVEIPFGLGRFRLAAVTSDSLRGEEELAGDTAVLALGSDPEPPPRWMDLAIETGEVRLAASLVLPAGPGPHPGVVLIHGSAPMGREDWEYRSWGELFARRGVAALLYDKRGVGASTGESETASLDDLTDDVMAALDTLRARPEVDPGRTGLSGGSQAGWIALGATARTEEVAFLVLRSAPAVTPAEQEEQSVVHRLRRSGRTEEEVQDALAHTRLFFYVVQTGDGWEELARSGRRAGEAEWGDVVQRPDSPEDLAWWRANHSVDPLPAIRELEAPTLLLYGAEDPIVPPALNAPVFRHAYLDDRRIRVEIFPHADHGLEIGSGRIEGDRWRFPHKADAIFEVLEEWLSEWVTGRDRGRRP